MARLCHLCKQPLSDIALARQHANISMAAIKRMQARKEQGLPVGVPRRIDYYSVMLYKKENPNATLRSIAKEFNCAPSTVHRIIGGKDEAQTI